MKSEKILKYGSIFSQKITGVCYITENDWISNECFQLFSDSAGNADLGCAAFLAGKWVQYQWPKHWENQPIMRDITFLELVPLVLALFVWGSALSNTKILFRIDNLALVNIVNKRTSKSKRVMSLIRPIVLYTMRYGIQFKTKHIEDTTNQIADSLSRFQDERFRTLVPDVEVEPEAIPSQFIKLISNMKLTD